MSFVRHSELGCLLRPAPHSVRLIAAFVLGPALLSGQQQRGGQQGWGLLSFTHFPSSGAGGIDTLIKATGAQPSHQLLCRLIVQACLPGGRSHKDSAMVSFFTHYLERIISLCQISFLETGSFPFSGGSAQLNPGLLHGRQILYQLSHKGSPRILERVAYPFSADLPNPGNQTRVSCTAGRFFTN